LSGTHQVDLRRQFSNVSPEAKSLVKRLVQRVGKAGEVRSDPVIEDARGPNVRELRHVQRRLSRPEVEALVADYEVGSVSGSWPRCMASTARRSRRMSLGQARPAAG
jgi:hypothetical protein